MGNTLRSRQLLADHQQQARHSSPQGRPPTIPGQESVNLHFRSRFLIIQNVICALLAVAVLATGFLIAHGESINGEPCAAFMHRPIIAVGFLLLLISLIGLFATIAKKWCDTPFPEWIDLVLVFCLVILLFCFAIFSLEITNRGLTHHVVGYGQSYKEYRLYEYPKWMQHRVKDTNYWSRVKTCLQHDNVCGSGIIPKFPSDIITDVTLADLTPIQGGCCIPPSACNISFIGSQKGNENQNDIKKVETVGANEYGSLNIRKEAKEKGFRTTIHAYTHDCNKWSSTPTQLCYDCDTCKGGVIQANMNRWKNAAILYVVLVMTMVVICALFACYGFSNRRPQKDKETREVVLL
ncbi:hypothetical protein GOP47_0020667 [Adiantum capillus-veneris]|uniref:Uncharacterized protein n=1 Tax=Adiantum capillus-veneris TaxID=13818 RepID=A0A9D4Z7Y4_ADICA|nr:hypothetical protein GOP47_0020667 [Adiantum capillus-veneris]